MDNNAAKKIAVTEALIKDAFLTALKREKYAEITISDICRIANIGRSTFYRRYESIPFVVNDIFADMLSMMIVMFILHKCLVMMVLVYKNFYILKQFQQNQLM